MYVKGSANVIIQVNLMSDFAIENHKLELFFFWDLKKKHQKSRKKEMWQREKIRVFFV